MTNGSTPSGVQAHAATVPARFGAVDWFLALAASLIAFAVYLATIYPGLFGLGDAAKFAFVGKVLGTPHAPGYPLYVMVSHVFSYLPIGSLAYRMNVLSAVLASVAVALLYAGCRTIGSRPPVAFAIALAFGFGRAFWSKAQYPKGYTLNAALVCAGIALLLRWGQTRRPLHLYGAIAIFALASGNHLIIVSLLPALVLYALVVDARTALSPKTIAIAALLVAAGLSQYSYILIRTRQAAPYLEASANNVRELVSVMTARRYANEIGAFTPGDVLRRRVPIVAQVIRTELGDPGLLLAAAGLLALCWRGRWREGMLFTLGAVGIAALTANMSSNEDEGFLLPAFALLWLLAAAGAEAVIAFISRQAASAGEPARRVAVAVVVVAALALPARQVSANYRRNDHSRRTFEIRYYASLFDALPDRSAIVLDKYDINMMLYYKLLGEDAAGKRDIRVVPQEPAKIAALRRDGFQIFAFRQGRASLTNYGYEFEPVDLYDVPLPRYLDEVPERWTVAIAATPSAAATLRDNARGWRRLGVDEAVFAPDARPYAMISSGGAARDAKGPPEARVTVEPGTRLTPDGVPAAQEITAAADQSAAWITIAGTERVRVHDGAAVALIDPSGQATVHGLETRLGLRLPFAGIGEPLFRVARVQVCRDIGNTGWQDISDIVADGQLSLVINNYRPFASRTIFYVVGAGGAPVLQEVSGTGVPVLSAARFAFDTPAGAAALAKQAATDGFTVPDAFRGQPLVTRIEVQVDDHGDQKAMRLVMGGAPLRAFVRATVDLNNPKRAVLCGVDKAGLPSNPSTR